MLVFRLRLPRLSLTEKQSLARPRHLPQRVQRHAARSHSYAAPGMKRPHPAKEVKSASTKADNVVSKVRLPSGRARSSMEQHKAWGFFAVRHSMTLFCRYASDCDGQRMTEMDAWGLASLAGSGIFGTLAALQDFNNLLRVLHLHGSWPRNPERAAI